MTAFTVLAGNTETARQELLGNEVGTIQATASLSVSANAQALRFVAATNGAVVNNSGTIEVTGGQAEPRAIRFENSVGATLNATINNIGGASIIQGIDDAIQIQAGAVTAGMVTVDNEGLINSNVGQAIDFGGGTGTFITDVNNSGTITALVSDAIRIGGVGDIVNFGNINGGSAAANTEGADGVQFEDNTSGTVSNFENGFWPSISGDRHGINAGTGSNITVNNGAPVPVPGFWSITGRNGSGVGSDGDATVINFGFITGNFTAGVDNSGPTPGVPDGTSDGDGDGIDIDGQATIDNYLHIEGTGASGHGSDGLPNTSEGIAAGGGTITNRSGALIRGAGLGILIDDSSQGPAPFLTTINNIGTITGTASIGIRIISNLADVIINSGTINGGGGGAAIQFGAGNNTLRLGATSVINGLSDGQGGTNTLDYTPFGAGGATVNLGAGTATGTSGIANFQNVIGSAGNDTITGSGAVNALTGGDGNDSLDGGVGLDQLDGGAGDDTYVLGGETDTVTDTSGTDTITSTITRSLASFGTIEKLTLLGTAAINGTGNTLANVITGNTGNNILDGGTGADTLIGGGGDDTYVLGGETDTVTDTSGTDTITSTITRSLAGFGTIEKLTLLGTAAIDGTGNTLANGITGNTGANVLLGLDGNDTLDGGGGIDRLEGGNGDDTYTIDSASEILVEVSGTDLVRSTATKTLATGFENLLLLGAAGLGGTGNAGVNVITGNIGANTLSGLGGNDTLVGNSGNDTLDGGIGIDRMEGGAGNDTFTIDSASDVLVEVSGVDLVRSTATKTLATGFENLTLITGNINGTGNAAANTITGSAGTNTLLGAAGNDRLIGNGGNDTLDGGVGIDRLEGGLGNDTYTINVAGDVLVEASGVDLVRSSVTKTLATGFENLTLLGATNINGTGNASVNTLTGNTGANTLAGLAGNDTVLGGSGNDALAGGLGRDTMTGGAGSDFFLFDAALAGNIDTITDFNVAADTMRLKKSIFPALGPSVTANEFFKGAGAHDVDDRLIYNSTSGALIYDSNGNAAGGATQFATLAKGLALTHVDFGMV